MGELDGIDTRGLNRATLARQLLLTRTADDPVEAVGQVLALQAQEPASPYLALLARVDGFDPARLDEAFASGALVRGSLQRVTLHVVRAEDHPQVHHAMQPTLRAARLNDARFRDTGLTPADADALVEPLRALAATPRRGDEFEAFVVERLGPGSERAWWALRHYAPLVRAPGDHPWSFPHGTRYVTAPGPTPDPNDEAAADVALQWLVRRQLAAFGPASVADLAQGLLVPRGRARAAVTALGDELLHGTAADGTALVDLPEAPRPAASTPAPPRLLPMWDGVLLAHHDRSRVVDDAVRSHVVRRNGDVLPTVLVDGRVAGVWRPAPDGVEAKLLARVGDGTREALVAEAERVTRLLAGRDARPWSRLDTWWERLPGAVVHLRA